MQDGNKSTTEHWYEKSRRENWKGALDDIIFTVISWLLITLNPSKLFLKLKFLSWLLMGFHSSKQFSSVKCIA